MWLDLEELTGAGPFRPNTVALSSPSLTPYKHARIGKARRQSGSDFFFLVYACVNIHFLYHVLYIIRSHSLKNPFFFLFL